MVPQCWIQATQGHLIGTRAHVHLLLMDEQQLRQFAGTFFDPTACKCLKMKFVSYCRCRGQIAEEERCSYAKSSR